MKAAFLLLSVAAIAVAQTPTFVSCNPNTVTSPSTVTCTVYVSTYGGGTVGLTSSSANVSVPATVTVGSSSTSASFYATVSSISSVQTVVITASLNSVSRTFSLALIPNGPVGNTPKQPYINVTAAPYNAKGDGTSDDTAAIQAALNTVAWASYSSATDEASTNTVSGGTIYFPHGKYLVKDTLPLRSNMHLVGEAGGSSIILFRPTTTKDLFSPPRSEMQAATKNWVSQTVNNLLIENLYLQGDLDPQTGGFANHGIDGANLRWARFKNVTVEHFLIGVELYQEDTSAWTGGTKMGNFYEIMFEGCYLHDNQRYLVNRANVVTWLGGTIAAEAIKASDPYSGDYFVENYGAGFQMTGANIAGLGTDWAPHKAYIYDEGRGSTYSGNYAEWFNTLFEVKPEERFGGFTAESGNYFFKSPTSVLVKFSDGFLPAYDPATGVRSGYNLRGPDSWVELHSNGVSLFKSSQLITDFFKFAPAYDFKYGLYGVQMDVNNWISYDVLRHQSAKSGFTSPYGIRFLADRSSFIKIPIGHKSYDANILVVYRKIAGNWTPGNIKLNVMEPDNTYLAVGEDVIDYGNGWRAAVVRNVHINPDTTGHLEIDFAAGDQVEIEHIGAYQGGYPAFPVAQEYTPKANSDALFLTDNSTAFWGSTVSGGHFAVGDVLDPYVPYDNNGIYKGMMQSGPRICIRQGINATTGAEGSAFTGLGTVSASASGSQLTLANTGTNGVAAYRTLGIGDWVGVQNPSGPWSSVMAASRPWDSGNNRYYVDRLTFSGLPLSGQGSTVNISHAQNTQTPQYRSLPMFSSWWQDKDNGGPGPFYFGPSVNDPGQKKWRLLIDVNGRLRLHDSTAGDPTSNTDGALIGDQTEIATAKGDIVVYNGSANTRLPVGTNTQVLTADSSQPSGVKWADPTGGSSTIATQAQAQAGTDNTTMMTPLRVADAISYQTPFPAQRAVPNASGPSTKNMYPRSDGSTLSFARPMNPGDGRRYAVATPDGSNAAGSYTTFGWKWGSGNLGGAVSYVAPTASSVGMLKQTSGTTDTSYAWIGNDANYVMYTAKNVYLDAWVAFGSTTAVRSNIFIADEGWAGTRAREYPNKGFGFRFSPATSSDTAIMCVTGNGVGNTSQASSGVAMDTSPHQYRIAEDSVNGAIYFYIDDMATPKCTLTTNIPTVATLSLQITSQVVGTGSAASVAFGWAYAEWDK